MKSLFDRGHRLPTGEEEDPAVGMDRRSVVPAALAAVGEAAAWFLPFKVLAVDNAHANGGPFVVYPAFVALLVCAVAVATALRRFRNLPSAVAVGAVGLGVVQSYVWGPGTVFSTLGALVLALVIAFRVVTLALRDWREPIRAAFGVGAAVLLGEVLIAAGGTTTGWRPLLAPLIVQFFVGGLASRAASLRLAVRPHRETTGIGADSDGGRRSLRTTLSLVVALGLLLGFVFLLGRRGGVLQSIGNEVFRLGTNLVGLMAYALALVLLRPFNSFINSIHLTLRPLHNAAVGLASFGKAKQHASGSNGSALLNRLLGLLFTAALAMLLIRSIRRRRDMAERFSPSDLDPTHGESTPLELLRSRRQRRRQKRELPEDTIRRWYAQTLLALEHHGLPKPSSRTPGEYLAEVGAAFPDCAAEFTVLTRAYEDVRYGSRVFDERAVEGLEPHRLLLMQTIRRSGNVSAN